MALGLSHFAAALALLGRLARTLLEFPGLLEGCCGYSPRVDVRRLCLDSLNGLGPYLRQ